MPLNFQQTSQNDRMETTLEHLNTTLISLRDHLAARNSIESHQQPMKGEVTNVTSLLPEQNSQAFVNNLNKSLEQASQTIQRFSQNSKMDIDDLTLFITQRFSSINFGSLFTNPISSLASFFTAKAHTGGFVNDLALPFQSDEVPIIAKRGEAIFTPEQLNNAENILQNSIGQKSNVTVNIHNNAPNINVTSREQDAEQGESNVDIVISEAESLMARRIAIGSGLAPVIESRYGVLPKSRGGI